MKNTKPTDAELAILQILWEHGAVSVRFVNDKLKEKRKEKKEIGYTTTLKIMQLMLGKGLVIRNTDARTHIYEANVKETETQGNLLQNFVKTTFRGAAMKMVMQALGSHKASPEELDEIKAMIKKMEKPEE